MITTGAMLQPGFANLAKQPRKPKVNLMLPLRLRKHLSIQVEVCGEVAQHQTIYGLGSFSTALGKRHLMPISMFLLL